MDPPNELCDARSDPDTRAVLEDWYEDRGYRVTRIGVRVDADDDDDDDAADADDDAAADAAADDDADADDDDDDDDDADDGGGVSAAAYAAAADRRRGLNKWLHGDIDMRDGLKIVKLPGGYYGRSVTRVGYVRRVAGDEYLLLPGARTLWRTGGDRVPIDRLASRGMTRDHRLSDPQDGEEELNRHLIRRCLPASVEAWSEHIAKPKDWADK